MRPNKQLVLVAHHLSLLFEKGEKGGAVVQNARLSACAVEISCISRVGVGRKLGIRRKFSGSDV